MENWLRNFDRVSFWLGFLAACLLWWVIGRLRPILIQAGRKLSDQIRLSRLEHSQGDEIRIGNDVLRKAQGWHLASALFSLDEIRIPTRLLAPPPLPAAYEPPASEDITDQAIPPMVDEPELASFYNAPTLECVEALSGGANLAIIGQPGSGKSFLLADTACQMIRNPSGTLARKIPLLIHAGELEQSLNEGISAEATLTKAVTEFAVSIPPKRLPQILHALLSQGKIILLLDGLDELSPTQLNDTCQFLRALTSEYPAVQVAAAAHPGNLGMLPSLGFQTIAIAGWNRTQRFSLIEKWSDGWKNLIAPTDPSKIAKTDPLLVSGWLLNSSMALNPLELTLKIWGAFAGDSLGPETPNLIETHLRRMLANQEKRNRSGVEQLAAQMILTMESIIQREQASTYLESTLANGFDAPTNGYSTMPSSGEQSVKLSKAQAGGALRDLISGGLIIDWGGGRISFSHPCWLAYLAGQKLTQSEFAGQIITQPEWCGRTQTLKTIAQIDPSPFWIDELLKSEEEDPLQLGLVQAGRWLPGTGENLSWGAQVLRRLGLCLQNEHLPFAFRCRALSVLVQSQNSGVALLLRQLTNDPQPAIRQLAALGLGYLRDGKSVEALTGLIGDTSTGVSRAALLALVGIGDKNGLESVARTLLNGNDLLRRAAAEALANDDEEGFSTLEEGSTLKNVSVRRAVVYGLGRLRHPGTARLLEKMAAEDSQWIVQDAASQQLQKIQKSNPRIPKPLPSPAQTPWLLAFAGERGIGVAPGKAAFDLLRQSVHEGTSEQCLAAIYYLGQSGDKAAVIPLEQVYSIGEGEIREAAFQGLWNLAACGISLHEPRLFPRN